MGSGRGNRKSNDKPVIRRPIPKMPMGLGVGSSGYAGGIAANICIPSFEQKIKKSPLTEEGVKVRLQADGARYKIFIGGSIVGVLGEKYSKIVKTCSGIGVRYSGTVILKKGGYYARFDRVS